MSLSTSPLGSLLRLAVLIALIGGPHEDLGARPMLTVARTSAGPNSAFGLEIRNARLEAPPADIQPPATLLKFGLLNTSAQRLTDVVLRVAVVEQTATSKARAIAGPFTIEGEAIIEAGYTFEFELLLRNVPVDCACQPVIKVVSARPAPRADV